MHQDTTTDTYQFHHSITSPRKQQYLTTWIQLKLNNHVTPKIPLNQYKSIHSWIKMMNEYMNERNPTTLLYYYWIKTRDLSSCYKHYNHYLVFYWKKKTLMKQDKYNLCQDSKVRTLAWNKSLIPNHRIRFKILWGHR